VNSQIISSMEVLHLCLEHLMAGKGLLPLVFRRMLRPSVLQHQDTVVGGIAKVAR